MSVIGYAVSLIRNLVSALKLVRKACSLAARVDVKIQASNASAGLKSASTTWKAATDTFCAAVEAFYDALPGD